MNDAEFNHAVLAELRETGRRLEAQHTEQMDRDMASMSSATVAREMGLPLNRESVSQVADARTEWVREHEVSA